MGIFDGKTFEGILKTALSSKKSDEKIIKENDENPKKILASEEKKEKPVSSVKSLLLRSVRSLNMPDMELELYRAFENGVTIKNIDGHFYLCYDETTQQYLYEFSLMRFSNRKFEWIKKVTQILASIVVDNDRIRRIRDFDEYRQALTEYTARLANRKFVFSKLLYKRPYIPDWAINIIAEDAEQWKQLITRVEEYNNELTNLLVYLRASKATLIKSDKFGYIISTDLMNEKAKKIYIEIIQPELMKHKDKITAILKSL